MNGIVFMETLIVLPLLLLLTLGIFQFALIYIAKSSLDHATFMAARLAAVEQGSQASLMNGLTSSMLALFNDEMGDELLLYKKVRQELLSNCEIKIINPTWEAFQDFGVMHTEGSLEIPNERLHIKNTMRGALSHVNIQDANLLKIQVEYGFPLHIPFVSHIILRFTGLFMQQDRYRVYLSKGRLPILSTAIVRMQSKIRYHSWVMTRQEIAQYADN